MSKRTAAADADEATGVLVVRFSASAYSAEELFNIASGFAEDLRESAPHGFALETWELDP